MPWPLTTIDAAKAAGLGYPTAGLMGQWAITRVASNSTVSGNMTALQAESCNGKPADGFIVVSPQNGEAVPDSWLIPGTGQAATSAPLFMLTESPRGENSAPLVARFYDFPDLSTPYVTPDPYFEIEMLSENMATHSIYNEFIAGAANFHTDWVLSMPTRRYIVGVDYAHKKLLFTRDDKYSSARNTTLVEKDGVPGAQMGAQARFWDINECGGDIAVFSPGGTMGLDGGVSVLSFNCAAADSVLGADLTAFDVAPRQNKQPIDAGWGAISFPRSAFAGDSPENVGLPVICYTAASAGGQNLDFTWNYRYTPIFTRIF